MHSGPTKFNGTYLLVSDERNLYRCCCGCIHIRTAAFLIGLLNILGAIIVLTAIALSKTLIGYTGKVTVAHIALVSAGCAIITLAAILLFIGIIKDRANFLIPYMVVQIVCIFGVIVWVVYAIAVVLSINLYEPTEDQMVNEIQMINARERREDLSDENQTLHKEIVFTPLVPLVTTSGRSDNNIGTLSVFLIITVNLIYLFLGVTIQTWYFVIVYKCYRYIRNKSQIVVQLPQVQYYGSSDLK